MLEGIAIFVHGFELQTIRVGRGFAGNPRGEAISVLGAGVGEREHKIDDIFDILVAEEKVFDGGDVVAAVFF